MGWDTPAQKATQEKREEEGPLAEEVSLEDLIQEAKEDYHLETPWPSFEVVVLQVPHTPSVSFPHATHPNTPFAYQNITPLREVVPKKGTAYMS